LIGRFSSISHGHIHSPRHGGNNDGSGDGDTMSSQFQHAQMFQFPLQHILQHITKG